MTARTFTGSATVDGVTYPSTVTVNVATGAVPSRTMPTVPHVAYTSLYRSGDTFAQACKRLTSYACIDLPDGFSGEIIGNTDVNGMGLYLPWCLGFVGSSPTQAQITVRAGSYSPGSDHPQTLRQAQGVDDNGVSNPRPYPTVNYGFTLNGTDQANQSTQSGRTEPMLYQGIVNYIGRSAFWQNIKVTGFPGDWYFPPGETFQIEDYKAADSFYSQVEVSGFNIAGSRVGGSPLGSSGGKRITIEDCYLHDSRASSLTFSYAGDEFSGTNTDTVTVRRTRVENNSNNDNASGHRFTGINFEGVRGTVLVDTCTILISQPGQYWDNSHVAIASQMIDNPAFTILEPTWNPLHPSGNGAFVVKADPNYGSGNKQQTPPKVVKGGVTLTAYKTVGSPSGVLPIDPARQFWFQQ